MKQIITKTCKHCGKQFKTRNINQMYCNLGCESDDKPEKPWSTRKANNPNQIRVDGKFAKETKKKEALQSETPVNEAHNEELEIPIIEESIVEEPIVKSHANSGFNALKIIKSSTRICKFCGKEYHPNAPGQKYCSPVCARNVSVEKLRTKKENRDNAKSFLRKCSQCGQEFRPTGNRQSFCPDCQRERRLEKNRKRYRDKTIKKLKAERAITGTISAKQIEAPYLAETNLANYITELEQKLSQIDSTVQLYKQLIDDNNRERVWLSEHIDRLKHIIVCEGHKCHPQNSASLIEQNQ